MPLSLKRKIIATLIIVAFVILLLNVIAEIVRKNTPEKTPSVSPSLVEQHVAETLDDFGILESWRKKIFFKKSPNKRNNYLLRVLVPNDVIMPILIRDICNATANLDCMVRKKKNGTWIELKEKNITVFEIRLLKSNKVKRKRTNIALLILLPSDADSSYVSKFIDMPYPLTLLFVPSKDMLNVKNEILRSGKKYGIVLNDEITSDFYLMKNGFSTSQLNSAVLNIVGDFRDACCFFVDYNSRLARLASFYFIKEKFRAYKHPLRSLASVRFLHGESAEEILSRFKFFEQSGAGGGKISLAVKAEDFPYVLRYLPNYLKKGNLLVEY